MLLLWKFSHILNCRSNAASLIWVKKIKSTHVGKIWSQDCGLGTDAAIWHTQCFAPLDNISTTKELNLLFMMLDFKTDCQDNGSFVFWLLPLFLERTDFACKYKQIFKHYIIDSTYVRVFLCFLIRGIYFVFCLFDLSLSVQN